MSVIVTDWALCHCCGRTGFMLTRVDGGRMHFDCWDKHHSDPTGPWPEDHECKGDQ